MVDLGFMKLPCAGDFSVFKLLFGMACACVSIATVFASTDLVGPALATSLDCQPDGIPDECQVAGDAILGYDETGVAYIAVRTDVPNMVWLQRFNASENGTIVSAILGSAANAVLFVACLYIGKSAIPDRDQPKVVGG